MRSGLTHGAALAAMVLACAAVHADDNIAVSVGYADNLRASGFFPSTWIGDPNVVSESSASQSFDAGAVRIDNNTAFAITITNFQVYFPNINASTAIWGSLTIAPGATGIFTQTASYNFDSSDFGIFGGLPPDALAPNNYLGNGNTSEIGGCSSATALIAAAGYSAACAAAVPVISFMAGTTAESFNDSGQVLTTGGWDFVNNGVYGEDGNESINWNTVGTVPYRGGSLVPEPPAPLLLAAGLAVLGLLRAGTRRRGRQPRIAS